MPSPLDQYVILLFGVIMALMSGRISILLCQKNKIIDYPGRTSHAIHSIPQPLGGGDCNRNITGGFAITFPTRI